jgi:hypothetical protein
MMTARQGKVVWRCAILMVVLAIGGCAERAPYRPTVVSGGASPVLAFQLGGIEILDETGGTGNGAVPADAFSVTPNQALQNWAAVRLRVADGEPGLLRFHMTAATAERSSLDGTPGIKGWFTRDQAEQVSVSFAGRLEARRNDGSLIASASAQAAAHRTFAEKTKPAVRRAGLDELVATALAGFDREIQARARADMTSVLR